ncbi:MAG TPA: TolC family protein [Syntrophorhabdaceae bacterium]|nr:TolC family protein [Syntrophorhabdaceae bacterium]
MNFFYFKKTKLARAFAAAATLASVLIVLPVPSVAANRQVEAQETKGVEQSQAKPSSPVSQGERYDLPSIIRYALKHNPDLKIAGRNIETETYGIDSAKADRAPKINFGAGITRYRYDTPIAPVIIELPLTPSTEFPPFRRTIQDTAVSFQFPLFKGGRLVRGVTIAEVRKAIAQDSYRMTRQDLVYNLTGLYYKIEQLEALIRANNASVEQLESHKKNVELYVKTGTAPRLDLLKTEVELSHALENRLLVQNNLASAYELLKTLMGMDDMGRDIVVVEDKNAAPFSAVLDDSLRKAFAQRSDYRAVANKKLIAEMQVKIAQGKRLPEIAAMGQYGGKAGSDTGFREDWYYGLRFTIPLLDGGLIRSEINKQKVELEKVKEEERSLRLAITRDVRDAHLNIANAEERIDVTGKAIESAEENLRVERLKYETGAGTTTDVIDAETASLRAETDYCQAVFDKAVAVAYLKKAMGEDEYNEEVHE